MKLEVGVSDLSYDLIPFLLKHGQLTKERSGGHGKGISQPDVSGGVSTPAASGLS